MSKLKEGQKAPELGINNQDGKKVVLEQLAGRKTVIYFYPKDDTPGCTKESCNLRDNYKELLKAGYEVIGISPDSEKRHQNFIAKYNLPFDLLADIDKEVCERYGVWVEKNMYGRKYMGVARTTFVLDENGIIEEVISKVNTKDHTSQILR